MTPTEQVTRQDWDLWYGAGNTFRMVTERELELLLRHTRVQADQLAVDVGCGTGNLARRIANWGLHVVGLDLSSLALYIAGRMPSQFGKRPSYEQWDAGMDADPFIAPGSVDLVTCRLTLPFLDRTRFLYQVGRWLRPGGSVYVMSTVGQHSPEPCRRSLTQEEFDAVCDPWVTQVRFNLGARTQCAVLRGYQGVGV